MVFNLESRVFFEGALMDMGNSFGYIKWKPAFTRFLLQLNRELVAFMIFLFHSLMIREYLSHAIVMTHY